MTSFARTQQQPNCTASKCIFACENNGPCFNGQFPPRLLCLSSLSFSFTRCSEGLAPRKKISNGQKGQPEESTDSQLQALFLLLGAEEGGGSFGFFWDLEFCGKTIPIALISIDFQKQNFKSPDFCNMFQYGSQNIKRIFKSFFFHLWSVAKFG